MVTYLKTPANKAARWLKRSHKPSNKVDLECLQNDDICLSVKDKIQEYLNSNAIPDTTHEIHSYLINALRNGKQQIPKIKKVKYAIPWKQDQELTNLHLERIKIRKLPETEQNKKKLKEITKYFKILNSNKNT